MMIPVNRAIVATLPPAITPACTPDLDGDDSVGFGDLTDLLDAWGPCGVCAVDLDGSGQVGGETDRRTLANPRHRTVSRAFRHDSNARASIVAIVCSSHMHRRPWVASSDDLLVRIGVIHGRQGAALSRPASPQSRTSRGRCGGCKAMQRRWLGIALRCRLRHLVARGPISALRQRDDLIGCLLSGPPDVPLDRTRLRRLAGKDGSLQKKSNSPRSFEVGDLTCPPYGLAGGW